MYSKSELPRQLVVAHSDSEDQVIVVPDMTCRRAPRNPSTSSTPRRSGRTWIETGHAAVLVLAEDTGVTWVVQSLASNEGALIVQPIDDVMLKQLVLASATDHPSA
jgi:hypothetical protein